MPRCALALRTMIPAYCLHPPLPLHRRGKACFRNVLLDEDLF